MAALKETIIKLLERTAEDLRNDNSHLSESEAMDIMKTLCHREMSKATACKFLNMSRSNFDAMIRARKLPKGRKRVGFTELVWYEDELRSCIEKLKK